MTPREEEAQRQRERIRTLEIQVGFLASIVNELATNAIAPPATPDSLRIMTKGLEGLNTPSDYRPHS